MRLNIEIMYLDKRKRLLIKPQQPSERVWYKYTKGILPISALFQGHFYYLIFIGISQ
jgi:hypothetical protein